MTVMTTWVSEISSLTHSTAGSRGLEGHIPIAQVTGDLPDLSEYLDFEFYDAVWFKDNAGSSPFELVISIIFFRAIPLGI